MINAVTGREQYLYDSLITELEKAEEIKIIVSFLRESGAHLLAEPLKKAAMDNGAEIKILTSRYLNITEPSALYLLKDKLGELAEFRFFKEQEIEAQAISFHPKAYFFKNEREEIIFIGSSNISYSALHGGIEWNYRLEKERDEEAFKEFKEDFDDLYHNYSVEITDQILKSYAEQWIKPSISREVDKIDYIKKEKEYQDHKDKVQKEEQKPKPRGAQIEALYELRLAREEGYQEGIVAAATGVGKTYLAAFDSIDYEKILFVAHREEILKQAAASFKAVEPEIEYSFFNGEEKMKEGKAVFASVQTLHKEKYLDEYFNQDDFDYIIVDEFHHAAAESYLNVLEYFEPDFLLGLTATPYRMDNKDIFALCSNNKIYEIDLRTAINRDLLVPFEYLGIYDQEVDYDGISYQNGKYNGKELEKALSTHRRADLIHNNYQKRAGKRTLGFCSSIEHAKYMTEYFNQQGVRAVAVHSAADKGKYFMERKEAVRKLREAEIKVIFAVDIFNEGVDIPELDTVLFLRPTESYVVFLQQLGRGLRRAEGKEKLKVLDFIGNYKRAHYLPLLLAGENPMEAANKKYQQAEEFEYPEGCRVNFDFKLLDLFAEMKKNDPLQERMKNEYFRLKSELKRRPLRLDLYQGSDLEIKKFLNSRYYDKGYLRFLAEINELNETEKSWLDTIVEEFLLELETTRMNKLYKMPILQSLIEDDKLKMKADLEEIGRTFMSFYKNNPRFQKDLNNKKHEGWQNWELNRFKREARINPVKFLNKRKFFDYDEVNQVFYLNQKLEKFIDQDLTEHFKDIVELRKLKYYNRRLK